MKRMTRVQLVSKNWMMSLPQHISHSERARLLIFRIRAETQNLNGTRFGDNLTRLRIRRKNILRKLRKGSYYTSELVTLMQTSKRFKKTSRTYRTRFSTQRLARFPNWKENSQITERRKNPYWEKRNYSILRQSC
jgi:hypothetical protein